MSDELKVERHGPVLVVTIDRLAGVGIDDPLGLRRDERVVGVGYSHSSAPFFHS